MAAMTFRQDGARTRVRRRPVYTAGIDTAAATARGQFELRRTTDTYLEDGRFDPDRMLAFFEQLASENAPRLWPQPHRVPDGLGRGQPLPRRQGDRVRGARERPVARSPRRRRLHLPSRQVWRRR